MLSERRRRSFSKWWKGARLPIVSARSGPFAQFSPFSQVTHRRRCSCFPRRLPIIIRCTQSRAPRRKASRDACCNRATRKNESDCGRSDRRAFEQHASQDSMTRQCLRPRPLSELGEAEWTSVTRFFTARQWLFPSGCCLRVRSQRLACNCGLVHRPTHLWARGCCLRAEHGLFGVLVAPRLPPG